MIDSVKPKLSAPSLSSSSSSSLTTGANQGKIAIPSLSTNSDQTVLPSPMQQTTASSSSEQSAPSERPNRSFTPISDEHIAVMKEHYSKESKPPTWLQIQSYMLSLTGRKYSQFYISSHRQEWGIPVKKRGPYLSASKLKALKEYYDSQETPLSWQELKTYVQEKFGISNVSKYSIYCSLGIYDTETTEQVSSYQKALETTFDPLSEGDDEAFLEFLAKEKSAYSTEQFNPLDEADDADFISFLYQNRV